MNGRSLIPSLCIASNPEWACIVNNEKSAGVYSWHHKKEEAQHNASIIDGIAIPVDYVNGELIVPPIATSLIKKAITSEKWADIKTRRTHEDHGRS